MSRRISHSIIDPLVAPLVLPLYRALHIPRRFPPEGIVGIGHLLAIGGAVGFAFSDDRAWGGAIGAAGVLGNHIADMVDGTHARQTDQCRNGGELLDHFTDPLSFSYWMIGLGIAAGRLDLALATVILIYATAVLTSIKAKMLGEFTLRAFGPTEFKALLALLGVGLAIRVLVEPAGATGPDVVGVVLWVFTGVGILQLLVGLVTSVREVNARGSAPDTSEWEVARSEHPSTGQDEL